MDGNWIPISLFLVVGVVLCAFLYFRYRARREVQETIRAALGQGEQLTPELFDRLSDAINPRDADLRRGVISVAVAIAVSVFALVVGERDAVGPLLGLACFPLLIGLAYLGLWRFNRPQPA